MIVMISAVSTIQNTIQASTSGMPSTIGSTWLSHGTPIRMPRNGRTASQRTAPIYVSLTESSHRPRPRLPLPDESAALQQFSTATEPAPNMTLPRIAIIGTGGTISGVGQDRLDFYEY